MCVVSMGCHACILCGMLLCSFCLLSGGGLWHEGCVTPAGSVACALCVVPFMGYVLCCMCGLSCMGLVRQG